MQFKAKTEKEIQEENLIKEGIYPFEVIEATDKKSRNNNDMIELKLRVFDGNSSRQMLDWIMPAMMFKLFHFCAYTGLNKEYEAGTLSAFDCKGKSGYCKVIIQEDKTGQYPPRNSISDYVRMPVGTKKAEKPAEDVPY
jgi:hypothetical protein